MAKLWVFLLCSVNGVGFARTIAENGALGEIDLLF
jgi:hypothetical protein